MGFPSGFALPHEVRLVLGLCGCSCSSTQVVHVVLCGASREVRKKPVPVSDERDSREASLVSRGRLQVRVDASPPRRHSATVFLRQNTKRRKRVEEKRGAMNTLFGRRETLFLCSKTNAKQNHAIEGNFLKICEGKNAHLGSLDCASRFQGGRPRHALNTTREEYYHTDRRKRAGTRTTMSSMMAFCTPGCAASRRPMANTSPRRTWLCRRRGYTWPPVAPAGTVADGLNT